MNIVKSLFVLLVLLVIFVNLITIVVNWYKRHKSKTLTKKRIIAYLSLLILFTSCIVSSAKYVYPFDIKLNPKLIAEYEVPQRYALRYPGEECWHGAYEKYGLYAGSVYFNTEEKVSRYGFEWPDMDFDKYSYIITYGQKIDSLSYNVWDNIGGPINTGAKTGHMILDDDFHPEKIYVYQIPKLRIENSRNSRDPWD